MGEFHSEVFLLNGHGGVLVVNVEGVVLVIADESPLRRRQSFGWTGHDADCQPVAFGEGI